MDHTQKKKKTISPPPWMPFKYRIFRIIWLTSTISNIGTWGHEVGAAWLMTTLTINPLLVALIQTATPLSIFLLALPAGALADILDRRAYLISLQIFMMIIAGVLSVTDFYGQISPELLIFLTFCLGIGIALNTPAWLAFMAELVPFKALSPAVTLVTFSINLSRALGPTLGGLVIAASGPAAVFALNALSFLAIIISLFNWKKPLKESPLPTERLFGAIRAGIRYLKGSPSFQIILIKAFGFFVFASAVWSLLPLVARLNLQSGPIGYGVLFASLGVGATISIFILPLLREKLNCDQLIGVGAIGFAITTFVLSLSSSLYLSGGAMVLGGLSWASVLATLSTLIQQVASSWVRARALAIFLTVFFGGMAIGGIFWGWVATQFTISI